MDERTEPIVETPLARVGSGGMRGYLVDLVIITVGVLIALSLEGVRQWRSDRALVREAEATLQLEIAENRREIDRVLADDEERQAALDQALRFIEELLADGSTEVTELDLGFSLAELSSASWITAERMGAIAHMDYDRVRALSRVYESQDLFVEQQRQSLGRLSAALAIMSTSDDPTRLEPNDLRAFRAEVLGLRAELFIQAQLAERARTLYAEILSPTAITAER
jgi:hypothetical protein